MSRFATVIPNLLLDLALAVIVSQMILGVPS